MSIVEDLFSQGLECHQAGDLSNAENFYCRALMSDATHVDAWVYLGILCSGQGRLGEAEKCLFRGLSLNPRHASAQNEMGVLEERKGNLDEAIVRFRQAIDLNPDFAIAHYHLGYALQRQNKLDAAIASFHQALKLKPDFAMACNNLGLALLSQEQLEDAEANFRRAIELIPDFSVAYNNLGSVMLAKLEWEKAAACFSKAVELRPQFAEAHNNLGEANRRQGKLDNALDSFRVALNIAPNYATALGNLGAVLHEQGKYEEAAEYYKSALRLDPEYVTAHLNQALIWLLNGDFSRGWLEYEWRVRNLPGFCGDTSLPVWDGAPLTGTILLRAEQGLGDSIQFIRYARMVKERVSRVIVECQKPLLPLLSSYKGIDQLVSQGDVLPHCDVQIPFLSLPRVFGTTLESIPCDVPYLTADPNLVEQWRSELSKDRFFKIGIAWQGRPDNPSRQRIIRLSQFAPLAEVEGVRLYSLQKGPGVEQLDSIKGEFQVIDFGSSLDEAAGAFMDTAAIMKNLDLVITADTSIPHLAGALGVPVWVALPVVCDWRWLQESPECPWYPTMRLFRQTKPGDWSDVFERIAAALRDLVKS